MHPFPAWLVAYLAASFSIGATIVFIRLANSGVFPQSKMDAEILTLTLGTIFVIALPGTFLAWFLLEMWQRTSLFSYALAGAIVTNGTMVLFGLIIGGYPDEIRPLVLFTGFGVIAAATFRAVYYRLIGRNLT